MPTYNFQPEDYREYRPVQRMQLISAAEWATPDTTWPGGDGHYEVIMEESLNFAGFMTVCALFVIIPDYTKVYRLVNVSFLEDPEVDTSKPVDPNNLPAT